MKPRYVTVSEVQDYLKCEWRWYAKWVLNRVPRRWSDALILGTAVHDILEAHFKGEPLEEAFSMQCAGLNVSLRGADPALAFATAKAGKLLHAMRPQIVGFKDAFKIDETLEVEVAFESPLMVWGERAWILRGRPDRVVRTGRKVRHMQHKTIAFNKSITTFVTYLARSMHETLYGGHLLAKYEDLEYAGSIINLFRKRAPDPGQPLEKYTFQAQIPLYATDMHRARMRLAQIVRRMAASEAAGNEFGIDALVDNPQEDAGMFGNSLDGYLPVLQGKAKFDDDTLFMDREDTYAAATE